MMPPRGTHKMIDFCNAHFPRWATSGEFHCLSDDPVLAFDAMRPAQLCRLLAAGKVGRGEIVAYEADVAARQAKPVGELENWMDCWKAVGIGPFMSA
ncbi:hypothetical protein [Sphingobium estronivorans]|uniref:hypothetical protein n=1 Tax=Sphingobium estronivorans TaxID=1577690 RepID=UPI001F072722|nr:hypothetical protein [Sphingobium estronivorans]